MRPRSHLLPRPRSLPAIVALLAAPLWLAPLILAFGSAPVLAQEDAYIPETDPLVLARLEQWQDLKLGLLMHWGPYSQWGVVESWSICSEDVPWIAHRSIEDYSAYKKAYEDLQTTFNPVGFDPDRWAEAALAAGMKYVVFTTKHHDGFAMFDTRQSDYRITSPRTPFSASPRADVTRAIFDAFRSRGFMIGAYFSKPDWHSSDYWWPYFATPDRNPNYSIARYPERWARFVEYTHAQVRELLSNYGQVDILWLDGGWVRPVTEAEISARMNRPDYDFARLQSQDIDMPRLVREARQLQPGLIVVDRAVPGPYQDYLTPEARVPDSVIVHPWEVPMPMATSWSFVPGDRYKSTHELVHLLVDVVAKGGNLLLNIGPGPDGRWPEAAYDRLRGLGAWLRVNGEAVYGTRSMEPFGSGRVRFTRGKDDVVYAIYLADDQVPTLPGVIAVAGLRPAPGATVTLLGSEARITWEPSADGFQLRLPAGVRPPAAHAWAFRISRARL